jgi:hypothetical protein
VFAIEARDFALRFTVSGSLFQVRALIARDLSLPHADLRFETMPFPVKTEDDESVTGDIGLAVKFIDLLAVEQELANTLRRGNFETRALIWLDVGVVKKRLSIFNPRKGVADVGFAGPDRLYFAAFQLNASFIPLEDVKIAESFPIEDRLGRHEMKVAQATSLRGGARRSTPANGERGRLLGVGGVGAWLDHFEGELSCDDFLQRNICKGGARAHLHHGPVSETELTHPLRNNVD